MIGKSIESFRPPTANAIDASNSNETRQRAPEVEKRNLQWPMGPIHNDTKSCLPSELSTVGDLRCPIEFCFFRTPDQSTILRHIAAGKHYELRTHKVSPSLSTTEDRYSFSLPYVYASSTSKTLTKTPHASCPSPIASSGRLSIGQGAAAGEHSSEPNRRSDNDRLHFDREWAEPALSQEPALGQSENDADAATANQESGPRKRKRFKRNEDGKFGCEHCTKAFTRATTLREHIRIHSNDRPFNCAKCSKTFTRLKDRNRHQLLHKGERKFICLGYSYQGRLWGCEHQFAREDSLAAHLRADVGINCLSCCWEDGGQCFVCATPLTTEDEVTTHLRSAKGESCFSYYLEWALESCRSLRDEKTQDNHRSSSSYQNTIATYSRASVQQRLKESNSNHATRGNVSQIAGLQVGDQLSSPKQGYPSSPPRSTSQLHQSLAKSRFSSQPPTAQSESGLSIFSIRHHKPAHKQCNTAHKYRLPYVVPRRHLINGPSSYGRPNLSVDNLSNSTKRLGFLHEAITTPTLHTLSNQELPSTCPKASLSAATSSQDLGSQNPADQALEEAVDCVVEYYDKRGGADGKFWLSVFCPTPNDCERFFLSFNSYRKEAAEICKKIKVNEREKGQAGQLFIMCTTLPPLVLIDDGGNGVVSVKLEIMMRYELPRPTQSIKLNVGNVTYDTTTLEELTTQMPGYHKLTLPEIEININNVPPALSASHFASHYLPCATSAQGYGTTSEHGNETMSISTNPRPSRKDIDKVEKTKPLEAIDIISNNVGDWRDPQNWKAIECRIGSCARGAKDFQIEISGPFIPSDESSFVIFGKTKTLCWSRHKIKDNSDNFLVWGRVPEYIPAYPDLDQSRLPVKVLVKKWSDGDFVLVEVGHYSYFNKRMVD